MKLTCIHIPPSTPEFRKRVAREASRFVVQLSSCGKFQDILAVRNREHVYVSTIPIIPL